MYEQNEVCLVVCAVGMILVQLSRARPVVCVRDKFIDHRNGESRANSSTQLIPLV